MNDTQLNQNGGKNDKEWRNIIKERDNSKCIICERTDIIHVHHIIPREIKKYRWNIDNGVCLCPRHHKYSFEISAHKNSFAFITWLCKYKRNQIRNIED